MLSHPTDPALSLYEISDLVGAGAPEGNEPGSDQAIVQQVFAWAQAYLCQPHPELGRSGPVCPFTRPSIRKQTFYVAVHRAPALDEAAVTDVAARYRDWFMDLAPLTRPDAQYVTINVVFPEVGPEGWYTLIEATQTRLKPSYVERGIMIGEFHPGPPPKTGLWNPEFHPLQSPVPLLSIRHMVPTDFAFLHERREFMEAYLSRHEQRIPAAMLPDVIERATELGLR